MNTDTPTRLPRLELVGITKAYPSVVANDDVKLVVRPGEIHAVLGENGAGKSTLMKIIYGVTKPDSGSVLWDNREVSIESPAQARKIGIGMVFQHFSLFETLTVAENISLALDSAIAPNELAQRIKDADLLILEGAGGAAVPLDRRGTTLSALARDLGAPALLACAPGLGTLHHTLSTAAFLREAGVPLAGFAICRRAPVADRAWSRRCIVGSIRARSRPSWRPTWSPAACSPPTSNLPSKVPSPRRPLARAIGPENPADVQVSRPRP